MKTQDLIADVAFEGHRFSTLEEMVFDQAVMQLTRLPDWAPTSDYTAEWKTTESGALEEFIVRVQAAENVDASIPTGIVSLRRTYHEQLSHGRLPRFGESIVLAVELDKGLSWEDLQVQYVRPLQNLISLGTDRPNGIDVLNVHSPHATFEIDGESRRTTLRALFPTGFHEPLPEKSLLSLDMIFTYQDVRDDFESIMQQWLRIAEEMRDLCDLFFSTFYGGRSFVENRFLTAVRALEVFHRQKFDGTDVPNKEHESRLKKILDSAPGEHRTWLKQKLRYSNEPTLRRRMHELLEHAGPLIDAVVRDRERFISMTVDTRNFFTHFDPASGSHVVRDPSTLHWLAERLLTLMKICLILELGVDAERCASWFNRNRRYRYLASTRSSASGA